MTADGLYGAIFLYWAVTLVMVFVRSRSWKWLAAHAAACLAYVLWNISAYAVDPGDWWRVPLAFLWAGMGIAWVNRSLDARERTLT